MEGGALQEESFGAWSKPYVLFCHITTQIKDKQYDNLLGQKGGRGFPYFAFLDAEGNVIAKHNGERNAEGFGASAKQAVAFVELRTKADGGDKTAKVEFFMKAVEIGYFTRVDAEKRAKEMTDLTDEQKKKVDQALVGFEVQDIAAAVKDDATKIEAGKKFAEMKKAGRVPTGEQDIQPFNIFIMDYAYSIKNATLFEECYGVLKEKFGARMNKKFKETRDKQLAEIKGN